MLIYLQTTMLKHLLKNNVIYIWFWTYCKKIATFVIYRNSDWNMCWQSGKSQGIFYWQTRGNPVKSCDLVIMLSDQFISIATTPVKFQNRVPSNQVRDLYDSTSRVPRYESAPRVGHYWQYIHVKCLPWKQKFNPPHIIWSHFYRDLS